MASSEPRKTATVKLTWVWRQPASITGAATSAHTTTSTRTRGPNESKRWKSSAAREERCDDQRLPGAAAPRRMPKAEHERRGDDGRFGA